jgi:hypothetical protein
MVSCLDCDPVASPLASPFWRSSDTREVSCSRMLSEFAALRPTQALSLSNGRDWLGRASWKSGDSARNEFKCVASAALVRNEEIIVYEGQGPDEDVLHVALQCWIDPDAVDALPPNLTARARVRGDNETHRPTRRRILNATNDDGVHWLGSTTLRGDGRCWKQKRRTHPDERDSPTTSRR